MLQFVRTSLLSVVFLSALALRPLRNFRARAKEFLYVVDDKHMSAQTEDYFLRHFRIFVLIRQMSILI